MLNASQCYQVFIRSIQEYHVMNSSDVAIKNPFEEATLEKLLYSKNWIDTVQWHLEDLIRDPNIDPVDAVALKRRIDKSNQDRTDIVERIDDYFLEELKSVKIQNNARQNSETPAWLLDRMSILLLKIYHMEEQVNRTDADAQHKMRCQNKLSVLLEQKEDMKICFDELMDDLQKGIRKMKVYRQMKMYNDASMNPVLYAHKN
jgi:Protein of unknown function (DUF4254)